MGKTQTPLGNRLRAWIDVLWYSVVVTLLAIVSTFVISILTGGGAVRANLFLFILGWLLLAYATIRLWPSSPSDVREDNADSLPQVHETRLQAVVRRVGPVRWTQLPPPQERVSAQMQLFVASVCILLASFILETVFGVA